MFSGIGGFELGIINAIGTRADFVAYSEIDKYAIATYEHNFKGHTNYGDATTINPADLPDFDLLVGGFPCQAFSIAGKRAGFNDTRGTLFFDIARIAREKQPMYMLLENVKGLISHDGGKTLEVILENLQDMGYYVNYEVHNSKDYGVPQNRERIYLLCRHAKLLEELGQNKKPIISKQIITEYLFQLLLNNLAEVRKLQETNSKEWVLGYLLSKEINQSLKSSDESIKAGITTLTDGSIFLLKDEELWQNIDTWLSKNLADGSNELSMSTILTAIRRITTSTTYTFSTMQQLIWLAIVALKKSQPNLWQKVLSDLILIKEDTKYARINNKKEEIIVTETGTAHITTNFQDYGERFIVGHLGVECRGQIFPIGTSNPKTLREVTSKQSQGFRVYETDGLSTTIASQAGGLGAKTGLYISHVDRGKGEYDLKETETTGTLTSTMYKGIDASGRTGVLERTAIPVLTPDRLVKRQNGRRFKEDGEPSFTLNTQDKHGIYDGAKIRRLTPLECERLQGFPDNFTKYDQDGNEISDTQRYKMCGNAVTVNVVQAVMTNLIKECYEENQL